MPCLHVEKGGARGEEPEQIIVVGAMMVQQSQCYGTYPIHPMSNLVLIHYCPFLVLITYVEIEKPNSYVDLNFGRCKFEKNRNSNLLPSFREGQNLTILRFHVAVSYYNHNIMPI